jgi:thiamine biosynthesis lipoprotein
MKKLTTCSAMTLLLFLIGYWISTLTTKSESITKRTQIIMGTVVEIQIRGEDEGRAVAVMNKAFAEIKRIDTLFSTYIKESPIFKINNSDDSLISMPKEIYELLKLCDELWKTTDGSLDVSLEALISLWGFDHSSPSVPDSHHLDDALKQSGWSNINLLPDNRLLSKNNVKLNFGAIAKGYAVNKAMDVLLMEGISDALINAGGEIKVTGGQWIIGIQHPREESFLAAKIKLENMAVATSGDYEQFFMEDGRRYHHILNPQTGFPADELQSVTVTASNVTIADGLATAVFVLGTTKGLKLIESLHETEAMIIDSSGIMSYSSGFKKFLVID